MRWTVVWMAAAIAGGLAAGLAGCDDKDDGVAPEVLAAQERAQRQLRELAKTPPRPTTQELLSGPRKSLRLGDYPLTLEVPQSWNLKSEGGVILVAGPATSSDVEIQLLNPGRPLGVEGTPRSATLDRVVNQAKSEAAAKPHSFNKVELRDLGDGVKVLEQRMISTPFVDGKLPPERVEEVTIGDPKLGPVATTRQVVNPHLMKWTFTVFIPEGTDKYTARALNFSMLSVSEFAQDREFLERMTGTLKYEK
jgi:hypothetical protein